jgi:hypothetical protein
MPQIPISLYCLAAGCHAGCLSRPRRRLFVSPQAAARQCQVARQNVLSPFAVMCAPNYCQRADPLPRRLGVKPRMLVLVRGYLEDLAVGLAKKHDCEGGADQLGQIDRIVAGCIGHSAEPVPCRRSFVPPSNDH